MNKAIKKMMLALAVCGALCGTAVAAPKGNSPKGGKAPVAMRAPSAKGHEAKSPAPAKQVAKTPARGGSHHAAPAKHHEPRHEVAHHNTPPPPVTHHGPKHHRHHHDSGCHCDGWCDVCGTLVGCLVGGLIGAAI